MYSYFKRRGKVDTNGFHHIFKSAKEESHLPSKAESPSLPSRACCLEARSLQTPLPKQTKYYHFQFFKVGTLLYCCDIQRIRIFLTTKSIFQKSTFWKFFPKIAIFQIFIAWVCFFISCQSLRWYFIRLGCMVPVVGWYPGMNYNHNIRPQTVKYTKVLRLEGKDLYK